MPATLTKIIDGKPAISDTLTNEQTVKCPRCEQIYRLGYSDSEWHRVKDWLNLAETAIRKDHDLRHEAATIPLEWRGIRRHEEVAVSPVPRTSRRYEAAHARVHPGQGPAGWICRPAQRVFCADDSSPQGLSTSEARDNKV